MKLSLENVVMIFLAVVVVVLIVIFGVQTSHGPSLDFVEINRETETTLDGETVTCREYHETVVSTYSMYEDLVDDCGIKKDLTYDEAYFMTDVLVVYLFTGEEGSRPKSFHDYPYSTNGKEIIKLKYYSNGRLDDENSYLYLVEIKRDDIGSFYVIIG